MLVKFAKILDGVEHGFFGREGGVSKGIYSSLNCGVGSGDLTANISENRRRIASAFGVGANRLLSNNQIHSTKVVLVKKAFTNKQRADAMVTDRANIALTVLTADCAPLLFVDKNAGIIAAAHAGWRGALAGVTDNTVKAMCEMGAKPSKIHVAIGPCISRKNYEVGEDFAGEFVNDDIDNKRYFTRIKTNKFLFDIKAYLVARLRKSGIGNIEALPDCTYGQNNEFFSYRYNTHRGIKDYGRNISVIIRKS